MKILLDKLCSKRLQTKVKDHLDSNELKKKRSDPQLWRDILAYWFLGLTTEFGYVLVICAAHDILHGFVNNDKPVESRSTAVDETTIRQSVCDAPSTGVLLLADIVPSVLMNISCPFLPLVKNFRMILVVALNVSSFLLISSTDADYLAIIGVVFTSLALGIGEVTLLSYSARFNKKVITAWSSGTGSAAIIGSISWAGLIAIGISPRDVLRIMLIVPVIQAAAFWLLLRSPETEHVKIGTKNVNIATIESNNCSPENVSSNIDGKLSGVRAKLKFIPQLAGFIAPLVIVFIFEYICVSGLYEMIHVQDTSMEPSAQYRWFTVSYQIGVFTARSLGALVKPRRTWWATVLQFINVCSFIYMAATMNVPSAWIVFVCVFVVGVIGGLCYVHTFHRVVKELPANQHKFSLGMMTMAESLGIAIGGLSAIPIRNSICGKSFLY